eukprot:10876995-Alexandrium_andersonii.AAC.1
MSNASTLSGSMPSRSSNKGHRCMQMLSSDRRQKTTSANDPGAKHSASNCATLGNPGLGSSRSPDSKPRDAMSCVKALPRAPLERLS